MFLQPRGPPGTPPKILKIVFFGKIWGVKNRSKQSFGLNRMQLTSSGVCRKIRGARRSRRMQESGCTTFGGSCEVQRLLVQLSESKILKVAVCCSPFCSRVHPARWAMWRSSRGAARCRGHLESMQHGAACWCRSGGEPTDAPAVRCAAWDVPLELARGES